MASEERGAPVLRGIDAIITCAARARGPVPLVSLHRPPLPPVSYGPGALYCGKGVWEDHVQRLRTYLYRGCCHRSRSGVLGGHRLDVLRLLRRRTKLPSKERGAPVLVLFPTSLIHGGVGAPQGHLLTPV